MDRILTCEVGKILGHYGSFLAVEQADPESSTNSFKIVLPPLVTARIQIQVTETPNPMFLE